MASSIAELFSDYEFPDAMTQPTKEKEQQAAEDGVAANVPPPVPERMKLKTGSPGDQRPLPAAFPLHHLPALTQKSS